MKSATAKPIFLLGDEDAGAAANAGWRRKWIGGRVYWLCQLAGWGGLVATWTAGSFDVGVVHVKAMIIRHFGFGLAGIIGSHLLRIEVWIVLARLKGWGSRIAGVAFALLGSSMAMLGMAAVVAWLTPPFNNPGTYFMRLIQTTSFQLLWLGFYFALTNLRNVQREQFARVQLDAALKDAEVRALKAQLNPHFLFNCLNSLRALVPLEQARPREAITLLADLLRAALTVGEQTAITLAQEMETVGTYLALEKIRFEDRLRITYEITTEARERQVPPFLVQVLVENAVKHGIAPREEGGEVVIRAEVENGMLKVIVKNPGRITAASDSTGLGLKNIRTRLRHLFGPEAGVALKQADTDLVIAEATVPYSLHLPRP
ncbi:MAG: histidine kinase [Nibricoccus sp.]